MRNGIVIALACTLPACATPGREPPEAVRLVAAEGPVGTSSPLVPVSAREPAQGPKPEPGPAKVDPPPPAPGVIGATPDPAMSPLDLDEVLAAVDRSYPQLQATLLERGIQDGRVLASLGAFDTMLKASTTNVPFGTYEQYRTDFQVNQRFTDTGLSVYSGYRTGFGEFPVYGLGAKTAEGGEFRTGVSIPLARDREIDRARAGYRTASLDRAAVEPGIEAQRLSLQRTAARVYWAWVAAGRQFRVARETLKLARDRDAQLRARQVRGIDAEFALVDNQRSIAQRNYLLVQAERAFQRAQIELSLFHRDESGAGLLAGVERLPTDSPVLPDPVPGGAEAAVAQALERRPELERLRIQRQSLDVQRALAENQTLPGIALNVYAAQDAGFSKPAFGQFKTDRSSLGVELAGDVPWQRRQAVGERRTLDARVAQLDFQYRMTADTIRAEVQDAFVRFERAAQLRKEAGRRVELTRQVADGERRRLDLGLSDVLRVTLREMDVFEAELLEVTAAFDYFQAFADYRAAVGVFAGPPPP
jgi:cobalt-zinc-cadmium efflux system outer membrane protein